MIRRFLPRPRTMWRAMLLALTVAATVAALVLWGLARDLPAPRAALAARGAVQGPNARFYDRHGTLLYELLPPGDEAGRREPLPLDRFPPALIEATLATEDAAFYTHPGLDWRGIARALRRNWREGQVAAGGSTLTQQVARTLLLPPAERQERTLRRKLREAILAIRLERTFSKDEILALYLNHTYYGNLAYGAEGAAQSYFAKHVWELSPAEAALLAGLPQAPALYNPLTDPAAAQKRQQQVLRLMVQNRFLSPAEAEAARAEPLHFAATPFPIEAPHFVMWALQQAEAQWGPQLVDGSGLRLITTLDLGIQDLAQATVTRRLAELQGRERGEPERHVTNAAVVVLDPATGDLLAMVGSADYFDATIDGAVNVALMPRQPGSALKPITYATAWDPSRSATPLAPASVLSDVPTTFRTADGKRYEPHNYDRRNRGPISLREALATSNNVVAVKVLEHVGVAAMVQTARDLGIQSLRDPARYDLTVTLGGGEVTLLELSAAYNTFAAAGRYRAPRALLRVEDHSGQPLWQAPPTPGEAVLDPRVAALISDVLADPLARAPTFGEWNALRLPFPAAAKTGTTTDWRDNWTLGYTPQLTVGVWVGNSDNRPMEGISGIDGAGPIWRDVMKGTLRHTRPQPFPLPDGLEVVEICRASGLLPDALCPERRNELFLAGQRPTLRDNSYQRVLVDEASGLLAAPGCAGPAVEQLFRRPPPEAMAWAQRSGWPFPPTRACAGATTPAAAGGATLLLLHPTEGARYRLNPTLPEASQRLPIALAATGPLPLAAGTLLLDGEPLHHFERLPVELFWPLVPGQHSLQAIGTTADGRSVQSDPIHFSVEGP